MKTAHILLLAILIVIALGVGFYIGNSSSNSSGVLMEDVVTDTQNSSGDGTPAVAEEGTTISTNNLTDGQKRLLGLLGVDADNIVVTPAMEACANAKVGEVRMQEIIAGATPSLGEGADLLACYKQ